MSEEKVQETPNKEQNTPIKNFTSFDFKKILSSFQSIFSVFKNKNISGKLVVFLAVITF
ncbi:hypothetical protein KKG31_08135 [Patescibacteria group bacterium]|nr:hypothetical protein [Patescibacteria group bacterium]MBU1759031.1 hypothetical protein [Patescibacteria group bacterium]